MDNTPVEGWFPTLSLRDQRRLVHTLPEPLTGELWAAVYLVRGSLPETGTLPPGEITWLSENQFRRRFDALDHQVTAAAFNPESPHKTELERRWHDAAAQFESLFGPIP